MLPIALDIANVSVLLIGKGEAMAKREKKLREAGAANLYCHSRESGNPDVWPEIPQKVRDDSRIVIVAGLSYEESEVIAAAVRAEGKLVNVEDVNDLCDFYFTANVKRGDLTISVSTNGTSPTLAKRVRDKIAAIFGTEWAGITEEIKQQRLQMRAEGKSMSEVAEASDAYIVQKNWFKEDAA